MPSSATSMMACPSVVTPSQVAQELLPAMDLAAAFSALGFLPAVLVHSAVAPRAKSSHRHPLVLVAYLLSGIAATLHAIGAGQGVAPSRHALLTLTIGYALVLVGLAITTRRRQGWQRNLSTVVLAAFAVSALHLSHDAGQQDSWLVALLGHHASLPLVLVILYQDYRFAFADLFLRRALSLVALVGLALGLHVAIATPLMSAMGAETREGLLATAVHIALWVATALAYPYIRRAVGQFVDRVILERTDFRHVRDDVAVAISRVDNTAEIMRRACAVLAEAIGARHVRSTIDLAAVPSTHATVVLRNDAGGTAVVRVPTTDAPCHTIEVSGLAAGRRILSDDVALLETVSSLVGRRIDAIRVTQERFARDLREREILQLAAESELRALRAQLNPHFLFNALTTIGYLMQAAPERALGTLYRLTDLLRAVLRRPAGEFVTLGEELDIVDAYLSIERERFEERLLVVVDVSDEARPMRIPPLLLQPLVENAVKHGISPLKRGGCVSITASVEHDRAAGTSTLRLVVSDTGVGIDGTMRLTPQGAGVGLASVEKRLDRHFGSAASFHVTGTPGRGTTVTLHLPAHAESPVPDDAGHSTLSGPSRSMKNAG